MIRPIALAKLPYGIQWSEGLLLSPQHLQQSDRFWQARIRYLIGCANSDFVGVRLLELDEGMLEKGRVVVRTLECVLDDGTPIVVQRECDKPLEFDAASRLSKAGETIRISIVLPLPGDASATRGSMNRRYESVAGTAALDENTGTTAVPIARLKPMVRLDCEWTSGANLLAGCPLFELERTSLGTFRRTAYHAPMAALSVSGFLKERSLQRRVEALRDAVRMKLREIAQAGEVCAFNAVTGDAFLAMAARRLAMILPGLDVLGLGADVAPRDLYATLAQAAGQMASLDALPDPPFLPPYDHFDCQPGFDAALAFIEARVAAIRPSFERLPFELDEHGQFSRALPADAGDTLLIEVVPAAAQSRADIDRWFETCAIGHPLLLDELDSRRMPGAAATLATQRRKGMSPAALYYEIHNASFDFADGNRTVFTPGEPLAIRSGSRRLDAPAAIILYREPAAEARSTRRHDGHEHARAARQTWRGSGERDEQDERRDRGDGRDEWQQMDPDDLRPGAMPSAPIGGGDGAGYDPH